MSDIPILFTVDDGLARVTLNRPDALNSLSFSLIEQLIATLDRIDADPDVRAVLITGSGRAFCAGADLTVAGPSKDPTRPRDVGQVVEDYYNPLITRLSTLRQPIVVAVNGAAVGAGVSLALQADITIAARSAYFMLAFTRVGLVPDAGSTWILPRLIGIARAKAMMLLAERVPAEEAADIGLIHSTVDDDALAARAEEIARRLADGPTVSFSLIRRAVREGLDGDLATSLQIEREAQREAGFTADYAEGVQAFRDKRPPRFTGR
jgi:2-(1,2-epoxy-1,2-dihydrophenyl)acetyl-CoA isomerase